MFFFLFPFLLFFSGFLVTLHLGIISLLGYSITFSTILLTLTCCFIVQLILLKISIPTILFLNNVKSSGCDQNPQFYCTGKKYSNLASLEVYFTTGKCRAVPVVTSFYSSKVSLLLDKSVLNDFGGESKINLLLDELKEIICFRNLKIRQVALSVIALYLLPFWCLKAVMPKWLFNYFVPVIFSPVSLFYMVMHRSLPLLNIALLENGDFKMIRQFAAIRELDNSTSFTQSLFTQFMLGLALFSSGCVQEIQAYHYKAIVNEY